MLGFNARGLAGLFFGAMALGAAFFTLAGVGGVAAFGVVLPAIFADAPFTTVVRAVVFLVGCALDADFLVAGAFVGGLTPAFLVALGATAFLAGAFVPEAGLAIREAFVFGDALMVAILEVAAFAVALLAAAFTGTVFFGAGSASFDCALPDCALAAAVFSGRFTGRFIVLVLLTTTSGGARLQHWVS